METINLSDIVVGDRLRKDYGDLSDLDTIETVGLIQPIILAKEQDGTHHLVAGGRRFQKLQELGVTQVHHGITCDPQRAGFVYREELPGDVRREVELYENIGRKAMSWKERICAIAEIHELKKTRSAKLGERWGQVETGRELGLTQASVSYAITIAEKFNHPDPKWREKYEAAEGLMAALRVLAEETEVWANREKAALIKETTPEVHINDLSKLGEESKSNGESQIITVPLSRMLRHCDMVQGCRDLGEESVDHIVTDWPYAIDMDYLEQGQGMDVSRVRDEHDIDDNLASYPTWLEAMYKVLKPKSFCVVWYDNVHFSTIRTFAEKVGFRVQRWPLVWVKTSPCLNQMAAKNWTKATEFAIVLSKENATIIKPQAVNYWSGPRVSSTTNPFAKPKGLWQWIFGAFCLQGDVVLDPFMGEWSCGAAAVDFGLRPVGFEINEQHYNQAVTNARELYEQLTENKVRFT